MSITQAMTASFEAQMLLAVHDFRPSAQTGASIFYLALYSASATIDANTAAYTSSNEVTGTGYVAGGNALTNLGVTTVPGTVSGGSSYLDFADLTFSNVTVTARGALVYNSTPKAHDNADAVLTNPSIFTLDFGSDKSATGGNMTIQFPLPTSTTAILRFA
jgi:hypothetical protein